MGRLRYNIATTSQVRTTQSCHKVQYFWFKITTVAYTTQSSQSIYIKTETSDDCIKISIVYNTATTLTVFKTEKIEMTTSPYYHKWHENYCWIVSSPSQSKNIGNQMNPFRKLKNRQRDDSSSKWNSLQQCF